MSATKRWAQLRDQPWKAFIIANMTTKEEIDKYNQTPYTTVTDGRYSDEVEMCDWS